MIKIILFVGALLLAAWAYYFQTDDGRLSNAAAPAKPLTSAAVSPSVALKASAASAGAAMLTPAAAPSTPAAMANIVSGLATETQPSAPAPDTRPEWVRNPPDLGLTRILAGDQAVKYDGRARTVLGTKEGSVQPILLVRDEASGQIDYFQSGLQFRLKPGTDFEAFIRERKAMQRYFNNSDYATVMVDAGSMASEYNALQNDPRVTLVTFLKLKTLTKPR